MSSIETPALNHWRMKSLYPLWTAKRYTILLFVVFLTAECLVNPWGEFPLNDDWSYSKSVYLFHQSGKLEIGDFGAMSLVVHLLWGIVFTKLTGFSFFALRLSTLISSLAGALVFNKLLRSLISSEGTAFLLTLLLMFNPLLFCLSNTYMTDVNFNTLFIFALYTIFRYYQKSTWPRLLLVYALCVLLVLIRQFGITLPLALFLYAISGWRTEPRRILYTFVGLILVFAVLKWYEHMIPHWFSTGGTYKYSGQINLRDERFIIAYMNHFHTYFRIILLQVMMYASIPCFLILPELIRKHKTWLVLSLTALSFIAVYFSFRETPFPFKNIFLNMNLGAETFYESSQTYIPHTYSETFRSFFEILKPICAGATGLTCILGLPALFRRKEEKLIPMNGLLWVFVFAYIAILLVPETYFDRYAIPLTTAVIVLSAGAVRRGTLLFYAGLILFMAQVYLSLAGTRDYLELNRRKQEAYAFLRDEKRINPKRINAGFEINCWNEGAPTWWSEYTSLQSFDYLIQFKAEQGFRPLKSYGFTRWFPFKQDKINIFVRDTLH
ncbi:MAG TPA: glycosyltransferase family 39 protein [Bacteroidia bacterium]|nr:glycosyltransferase family 39 protein [Bacteroidia bacterium]